MVFGSQTPAISNFSASALDVVVGPQLPGPVSVSVTRPNGEIATSSFPFFYLMPTLSSFSPSAANGFETTTVTISGTNFTPDSTVVFGSQTPAISNFSAGAFDVVVGPQLPGSVSVSVTRPNAETATSSFSFFYVMPTLTSFSPEFFQEGASGTVTIEGTNFIPGMTVQFGSQSPTPTNITATSLDVAVGPFLAGDQTVVVTRPDNGESATATFLVGAADPGLVFVAGLISGNMGGLSGADAICQAAADAVPVFGSYKAWLSTSTESPSTRFRRDVGPYINTQGQTLANNWDDLTDGTLAVAVLYAADGTSLSGSVYTDTDIAGDPLLGLGACSDWTSTDGIAVGGDSSSTDGGWTNRGIAIGCAQGHIYCFED